MDRKNRSQKKAIAILSILCVLLIGFVVYLQIRVPKANADAHADYEKQLEELTAKATEKQEAYDSATVEGREEVGYDNILDAMKDEVKALEKDVKALEKEKKEALKALEEAAAAPAEETTEEAPAEETTEEAPAEEAPAEEAPAEEAEATEAPTEG